MAIDCRRNTPSAAHGCRGARPGCQSRPQPVPMWVEVEVQVEVPLPVANRLKKRSGRVASTDTVSLGTGSLSRPAASGATASASGQGAQAVTPITPAGNAGCRCSAARRNWGCATTRSPARRSRTSTLETTELELERRKYSTRPAAMICSTPTISRPSTTASATPPATPCCATLQTQCGLMKRTDHDKGRVTALSAAAPHRRTDRAHRGRPKRSRDAGPGSAAPPPGSTGASCGTAPAVAPLR